MRTKNILPFLFVGMILASCNMFGRAAPRVDSFSFVFKYTPCGSVPVNVFDSASSALIHTPLDDNTSITISLRLTDDELDSIYQKAISIGFFDYPANFVVPDDQVIGTHTPASSYELSVTNGKLSNSVIWTDDTLTKPSYTKADRLRELMDLIDGIIRSHEEYKQVPEPHALCL